MAEANINEIILNAKKLNDDLTCPITLDVFKDPVFIPECGHTFDRNGLNSLSTKYCPICKNSFSGNTNDFMTNWVIASILGISIKQIDGENVKDNPKTKLLEYDATKATHDRQIYVDKHANALLLFALSKIKTIAVDGGYSFDLNLSHVHPLVLSQVEKELHARKFILAKNGNVLKISWN